MPDATTERAMATLNRLMASHLGSQPNWRCWTVQAKGRYRAWKCGWTTEREPNGKFASFVYERTKRGLELKRKVSHSTRTAAKRRAGKLYQKRYNQVIVPGLFPEKKETAQGI